MRFLDTNVILRYLTKDDEAKAEASYRLFQRVKRGDEEVLTCEAVVSEVVYVLSKAPEKSRGPFYVLVAGVGFEPTTFGL